jgi:HSP20 family protein
MTQPVISDDNQVRPWTRPASVPPNVWVELDRLRDDLRRLLGRIGLPETAVPALGTMPAADVEETDDAFVVEVELPGVRKDDVVVSLDARRLTVDAERRERRRTGVLHRRTRAVGHLHYEVVVPGEVDEQGVTATLDDGVLTVRLGKLAPLRARRIPVS